MLSRMRLLVLAPLVLLAACAAAPKAVTPLVEHQVYVLQVDGNTVAMAGAQGVMQDDARFGRIVRNVSQPTLTAYLPDPAIATGAAVVIAPGGGFHMLSIENEGTAVAEWLNSMGVAAFVLRYRLIETGNDFPMVLIRRLTNRKELDAAVAPLRPLATADGEAAIRMVRENAAGWNLSPKRIGMIGFSAGGAVTVWDLQNGDTETRPDFAATIYPGLLPDPIVVPRNAPPLFVVVAEDDALAHGDSLRLAKAWGEAGAPVDLTTYKSGGHGFGMAQSGKPTDAWRDAYRNWLNKQGALSR